MWPWFEFHCKNKILFIIISWPKLKRIRFRMNVKELFDEKINYGLRFFLYFALCIRLKPLMAYNIRYNTLVFDFVMDHHCHMVVNLRSFHWKWKTFINSHNNFIPFHFIFLTRKFYIINVIYCVTVCTKTTYFHMVNCCVAGVTTG